MTDMLRRDIIAGQLKNKKSNLNNHLLIDIDIQDVKQYLPL